VESDLAHLRVAGVSHYQDALERVCAGEPVRFVHEPDNPFDETAIRVVSAAGETIGYVPRKSWLHCVVHQQGRGVSAVVASVGYSRACLLGATLSVAVCDDTISAESYFPDQDTPDAPQGGFRYWIKTPADAAQLVKSTSRSAWPTQLRHQ